ncbi:MAG: FAD-binding oxidoreductase, partial [Candidatus Helarchaeota archaeon]|nr:FAD-binding oxidoreductase [Candidatus Helarchaeota archaeon]
MVRKELVDIVGSDYVLDDDDTLTDFSKDYSFTPHIKPDYVVLPENLQEIQEIVTFANTIKMPVIPRSSDVGFYGSGIPTQGGIIVKLTRMKKILNIDTRNKAARIQPGVRFGQLQEELKKHNLRALNPLLPHLGKSVITSYLETIPALIPKFEYSDPILTMEMVMPEGNLFRTGGAAGSWA